MLKPQNIIQAAEEDFRRKRRNAEEAEFVDPHYEHYAFLRRDVHAAKSARELMILALMNPPVHTGKANTRMIYGDTQLLIEAIKMASSHSEPRRP